MIPVTTWLDLTYDERNKALGTMSQDDMVFLLIAITEKYSGAHELLVQVIQIARKLRERAVAERRIQAP